MTVTLTAMNPVGDREALVSFLTSNLFPFHVCASISRAEAEQRIDTGCFGPPEHEAFRLDDAAHGRIGYAVLNDMQDDTPLLDLRLATKYRRSGCGVPAVVSLTNHVFSSMPKVNRFEGKTRDDNIGMRKTFLRAGFLKEAHYREAWPLTRTEARTSVAYAILRRDWETGETTPVPWDDLPAQ